MINKKKDYVLGSFIFAENLSLSVLPTIFIQYMESLIMTFHAQPNPTVNYDHGAWGPSMGTKGSNIRPDEDVRTVVQPKHSGRIPDKGTVVFMNEDPICE